MAAAQTRSLYKSLNLEHHVTPTSLGCEVHSYTSNLGPDVPILTLFHGYPQSAYIWRHVVPRLSGQVSLFVPELPGYGISSPIHDKDANSKRGVGTALLEALAAVFQTTSAAAPRRIILAGHDRGARISHRLAVDFSHPPAGSPLFSTLNLALLGAVLIDIVPTLAQWQAFADPAVCTGYFHWPLLANPDMATAMIMALGGAQWAKAAHTRIAGPNLDSLQRITADNALDVYGELFDQRDTIYYSSLDYAAGAAPEATEQERDQQAGRKVAVPLLVLFSQAKLGARLDVGGIWRHWVADGVDYEGCGVGDGRGHYLPEEAYEVVSDRIQGLLRKVT